VKDRILLAIYNEFQKDLPDMKYRITYDELHITKEEFYVGLEKLENEELIKDGNYSKNGSKILLAFLDNVKPSVRGIQYVEQKLLSK